MTLISLYCHCCFPWLPGSLIPWAQIAWVSFHHEIPHSALCLAHEKPRVHARWSFFHREVPSARLFISRPQQLGKALQEEKNRLENVASAEDQMSVTPPNSYAAALTLNVVVLGGGAFGR